MHVSIRSSARRRVSIEFPSSAVRLVRPVHTRRAYPGCLWLMCFISCASWKESTRVSVSNVSTKISTNHERCKTRSNDDIGHERRPEPEETLQCANSRPPDLRCEPCPWPLGRAGAPAGVRWPVPSSGVESTINNVSDKRKRQKYRIIYKTAFAVSGSADRTARPDAPARRHRHYWSLQGTRRKP